MRLSYKREKEATNNTLLSEPMFVLDEMLVLAAE